MWPFGRSAHSRQVDRVDAAEAFALQQGGAALVDVREPSEFKRGHARGARSMPLGKVKAGDLDGDRTRPVVVICATGHRSRTAARALAAHGWTQVYDARGGMVAWSRAGLPVKAGARR